VYEMLSICFHRYSAFDNLSSIGSHVSKDSNDGLMKMRVRLRSGSYVQSFVSRIRGIFKVVSLGYSEN
jgi:hypothetical protein